MGCDQKYCSVVEEKHLQWQCRATCGLCNTDPSTREMDQMCDNLLGPEVRAKYKSNYRPPVTKPKPPQKFFNSKIVTARSNAVRDKPSIVTSKPRIVTAKPLPVDSNLVETENIRKKEKTKN